MTAAAPTSMETAATPTSMETAATGAVEAAGGLSRLGGSRQGRRGAPRPDHRIVVIDLVRRSPHEPRRVESPAEWAIQDAISRQECVAAPEGIPVPAKAIPPAVYHDGLRRLNIGLRFILAPQFAPAVQRITFDRILVEALRFERLPAGEQNRMALFQVDVPVSFGHCRFTVQHADGGMVRIEIVQSHLVDPCGYAIHQHGQVIFLE